MSDAKQALEKLTEAEARLEARKTAIDERLAQRQKNAEEAKKRYDEVISRLQAKRTALETQGDDR